VIIVLDNAFVYDGTGSNPSDEPDELGANLQKIAEATAKAITDEGSDDGGGSEFAAAISQTLKNLSEGAENLQVSNINITYMDSDCPNLIQVPSYKDNHIKSLKETKR
jgi:cell division ATPase FtsA